MSEQENADFLRPEDLKTLEEMEAAGQDARQGSIDLVAEQIDEWFGRLGESSETNAFLCAGICFGRELLKRSESHLRVGEFMRWKQSREAMARGESAKEKYVRSERLGRSRGPHGAVYPPEAVG